VPGPERGHRGSQKPHDLGFGHSQDALELTGQEVWRNGLDLCVAWFLGSNDAGLPMYNPASGGAFDGLHAAGVNRNEGAESTLAALTTFQLARRIAALAEL